MGKYSLAWGRCWRIIEILEMDSITRVYKVIRKPSYRTIYDGNLAYIQDMGVEDVNLCVLRSALQTVERIELLINKEVYSHITWKIILSGMLNLP